MRGRKCAGTGNDWTMGQKKKKKRKNRKEKTEREREREKKRRKRINKEQPGLIGSR